jgi:DNA-3-methyladenine glycosylase
MYKLARHFYEQDTTLVAQALLGKYLIKDNIQIAKIVEVEAYLGAHDLACHASKGLTKRTEVMFGPAGHAYVYMIYGIYYCFNVITEPAGHPSGVLIRAVEPIANITHKTNGPGLLCKAMNIDRMLNGYDVTQEKLFIAEKENEKFTIIKRPRIGVNYSGKWAEKHLRFYIKDNPYISKV